MLYGARDELAVKRARYKDGDIFVAKTTGRREQAAVPESEINRPRDGDANRDGGAVGVGRADVAVTPGEAEEADEERGYRRYGRE